MGGQCRGSENFEYSDTDDDLNRFVRLDANSGIHVMADEQGGAGPSAVPGSGRRGRIVRRYFLIFATLVGGSLVASVFV